MTGEEVARSRRRASTWPRRWTTGGRTGGPALRALTFHQRAALLKSLGVVAARAPGGAVRAVGADRRRRWTTPGSTWTAASACCSATPARPGASCPTTPSTSRARPSRWAGAGSSSASTSCTPLRGVAVQINAFNFPVWGPLEKFAPGVPRGHAQPGQAGQPDRLPHRAAGRADRRLRPAAGRARCSWSAGAPATCSTTSTEQDLVAFTGSAATARTLRAHPAVVARAVRFNAEADSLNCSILGPDAAPGTPEFDLFVEQLVDRDDGQGGPEVHRDPAGARARRGWPGRSPTRSRRGLAEVVVGNPAEQGVRMGALASLRAAGRGAPLASRRCCRRGRAGLRRPGAGRGRRRRRRAGRVHLAAAAALRRRRPGRAARGGGVRPGEHGHRLPRRRRRGRARGPRPGQPGRVGRHRRPRRSPARW